MGGIILSPAERDLQRIVDAIREANQGRDNATGSVTLRLSQTTTVVTKATAGSQAAVNVGKDSQIFLTPRDANAAGELASIYISAVGQGTFTITHPSNTDTRTFGWRATG